jgi:hypothetical protein
MGRTHRKQVALYLDADRVELLQQLAKSSGLTQQDLLRKAVDALLVRHRLLKVTKRRTIERRLSVVSTPRDA